MEQEWVEQAEPPVSPYQFVAEAARLLAAGQPPVLSQTPKRAESIHVGRSHTVRKIDPARLELRHIGYRIEAFFFLWLSNG